MLAHYTSASFLKAVQLSVEPAFTLLQLTTFEVFEPILRHLARSLSAVSFTNQHTLPL